MNQASARPVRKNTTIRSVHRSDITMGRRITAVPVTPNIERKMRQKVESRTNGTVEFQTEVNPEIIGGYILEYDTYRLDASIQNQLRAILAQLSK